MDSGKNKSMAGVETRELGRELSNVKWSDVPVIIVFFLLFLCVALQFFTRYVLNDSLGWTEEIARYLLVIVGFAGSVICVRSGGHIFLEFAHRFFSKRILGICLLFVEAVSTFFWGWLGWLAFNLAGRTKSNMASINLSKSHLYYIVAVCCVAMAFCACINLIGRFQSAKR